MHVVWDRRRHQVLWLARRTLQRPGASTEAQRFRGQRLLGRGSPDGGVHARDRLEPTAVAHRRRVSDRSVTRPIRGVSFPSPRRASANGIGRVPAVLSDLVRRAASRPSAAARPRESNVTANPTHRPQRARALSRGAVGEGLPDRRSGPDREGLRPRLRDRDGLSPDLVGPRRRARPLEGQDRRQPQPRQQLRLRHLGHADDDRRADVQRSPVPLPVCRRIGCPVGQRARPHRPSGPALHARPNVQPGAGPLPAAGSREGRGEPLRVRQELTRDGCRSERAVLLCAPHHWVGSMCDRR